MRTSPWRAPLALRMRVSMSAIGSEMTPVVSLVAIYQLDFVTPGMRPSAASVRKQMRHMPNFRMNARGRPQSRHRLWNRTLNLGARFQRSIADFFAKIPLPLPEGHAQLRQQRAALLVCLRRRHDGNLEAADLVDAVVIDLGKDDLLAQAQGVVVATVECV